MNREQGLGWKESEEMNNKIGEMKRTEKGQSGQLEDTYGGVLATDKGGVYGVEIVQKVAEIR